MSLQCYSIRDEKAACFLSPYFAKSTVEAVRSLTVAANDPQSNLNRFADDFGLYLLGVVDENTGVLTPHVNGPERITQISILIKQPSQITK